MSVKFFKSLLLILSIIVISNTTKAQDSRITQYYTQPLQYNPANVGLFNGTFRTAALFRNQFYGIKNPVQNAYLAVDFPINNLGLSFTAQSFTAGVFQNLSANIGIGYKFTLSKTDKVYLAIGAQGGVIQKSINNALLDFGQAETITGFSAINPDVNGGISIFNGNINNAINPFIGAAVYHAVPAKQGFLSDAEASILQRKITGNAGFQINLSKKFDVTPQVLFVRQNNVQDVSAGLVNHYYLRDNDFSFLFGGGYRLDDGINALLGGQYKDFFVGLSYDVNTSPLNAAAPGADAFELSIIYCKKKKITLIPDNLCPRL